MRWLLIVALVTGSIRAQSARDYYNELYKAGGLDRIADRYVCFADDVNNKNFFLFAESDILKQFLQDQGQFRNMTKSQQRGLNKGFLIVRGYTQGVPFSEEETYDKDGDSWISPGMLEGKRIRVRLTIAMATLRYKRSVEVAASHGAYRESAASYGRCESISPDVRQRN